MPFPVIRVGDIVLVQTASKGEVEGVVTDRYRRFDESYDRCYVQTAAFPLQLCVPVSNLKKARRARRVASTRNR